MKPERFIAAEQLRSSIAKLDDAALAIQLHDLVLCSRRIKDGSAEAVVLAEAVKRLHERKAAVAVPESAP